MARFWSTSAETTTTKTWKNKTSKSSPLRPRSASRDHVVEEQQQQQQQQLKSHDTATTSSSPRRTRFNSRDIPRTYSGLYGNTDDLLPFELNRNRGTLTRQTIWFLLLTYLTLLSMVQLLSMTLADSWQHSWTYTNAIHLIVTLLYIHWLKGSLSDSQGEMAALTLWEQLEATQDTRTLREALLLVPTILTYAACHFANYDIQYSFINVVIWCIAMLAKLPFMNGVRIFGINRTAGIDDTTEDENENNTKKKQ